MMNIRAKMACTEVKKTEYGSEEVKLSAVVADSKENKTFAKATPNASVQMTIDNPSAQGQFVEGQEYYVDFKLAAKKTQK